MTLRRVSSVEAYNRLCPNAIYILDCCLQRTHVQTRVGIGYLDVSLDPAAAAQKTFNFVNGDHGFPPDGDGAHFTLVLDEEPNGRGDAVARWLLDVGGLAEVWLVDGPDFMRRYDFVFDAWLPEAPGSLPDALDYPQEIVDGALFLGSINAVNEKVLKDLRISHVVSLVERPVKSMPESVGEDCRLWCKIEDSTHADLRPAMEEALPFLNRVLNSGARVLVHCEQGRSRFASLVIAHLMLEHHLSFEQADNVVKAQRRMARPNTAFIQQLKNPSWQPQHGACLEGLVLVGFVAKPRAKLRNPIWMKVKDVTPDSRGLNLMLKVVTSKEDMNAKVRSWEVVVGDQTAIVTLRLVGEEHVAICQTDASIRVPNARVLMIKGFIRVIVDKWGVLKAAESPLNFDARIDKDVSATEY